MTVGLDCILGKEVCNGPPCTILCLASEESQGYIDRYIRYVWDNSGNLSILHMSSLLGRQFLSDLPNSSTELGQRLDKQQR